MNKKDKTYIVSIEAPKEKADHEAIADLSNYSNALINYSNFSFVATAIHDKDKTAEGKPRKPHLHAFMELHEKATFKAFLGELVELLRIDQSQISLEPTNSQFLGVQYLIHKNDPKKYQYEADIIKTNNNEILQKRLDLGYIDPQQEIYEAITKSNGALDLIQKLGIEKANKYLRIFNQVKTEQGADLKGIILRNEKIETTIYKLSQEITALLDKLDLFFEAHQVEKVAFNYERIKQNIWSLLEDIIF